MSVLDFPEVSGRPFEPAPSEELESVASPASLPAQVEELVEWTPQRAAAVVRGLGYGLHALDPAAELPGGEQLWRATAQDAEDIGQPLARILARYAPARRLAGVVDEAELGAAFVGYAKRNMKLRGQLKIAARDEDAFSGDE